MTAAFTGIPITGTFGAELSGARLAGDQLLALLEEHRVLAARGQFLTHAERVTLARALGEPTPAHPVASGHPDHPEILELDGAKGGRNARWDTDVTFVVTPPAVSVLVADALPAYGGDTMWADTRSAYERLPPALRAAVDGLEAVHRISPLAYWGEPFDTALGRDDAQQLLDDAMKVPPVIPTSQNSSPVQVLTLPYTDPIGPKAGVTAVVVNITATGFATGWLTAYGPWGSAAPATSTLNYNQYETESTLAIIEVNDFTQGAIAIKNGGTSSTYVTVDVVGYILSGEEAR